MKVTIDTAKDIYDYELKKTPIIRWFMTTVNVGHDFIKDAIDRSIEAAEIYMGDAANLGDCIVRFGDCKDGSKTGLQIELIIRFTELSDDHFKYIVTINQDNIPRWKFYHVSSQNLDGGYIQLL